MAERNLQTLIDWLDLDNIAEELDERELAAIGKQVKDDYDAAVESMEDWKHGVEKGLELAKPAMGPRSDPWEGASNHKEPALQSLSYRFGERAEAELLRQKDLAKGALKGPENDQLSQIAEHVGDYLSYELNYVMPEWRPDHRKLLYSLPLMGSMFKKSYFDPLKGRNVSTLIQYPNFAVHQNTENMNELRDFTHIFDLPANDIITYQRAGLWLDIDLPLMERGDDDDKDAADNHDSMNRFLEQQCFLDLDEDGYEEPYLVTVHEKSATVVRIYPRFGIENIYVEQDGEIYPVSEIYGPMPATAKEPLLDEEVNEFTRIPEEVEEEEEPEETFGFFVHGTNPAVEKAGAMPTSTPEGMQQPTNMMGGSPEGGLSPLAAGGRMPSPEGSPMAPMEGMPQGGPQLSPGGAETAGPMGLPEELLPSMPGGGIGMNPMRAMERAPIPAPMPNEIINIVPARNITKYDFLPSLDGTFLGVGYFYLMSALIEAINSGTNLLFDAAALANLRGGLLAEEAPDNLGENEFAPGDWIQTNVPAAILQGVLLPHQYADPSAVLLELVNMLKQTILQLGAAADLSETVGTNTAASTILMMIEESQGLTTAIMSEIARAMSKEYEVLAGLIRQFGDPVLYQTIMGQNADYEADFGQEGITIVPTANPEMASRSHRLQQAEMIRENQEFLVEAGADARALAEDFFEAIGVDEIEKYFPQPTPEEQQREQEALDRAIRGEEATIRMMEAQANDLDARAERSRAEAKATLDKLTDEVRNLKADMILTLERAETEQVKNQLDDYIARIGAFEMLLNDARTREEAERTRQENERAHQLQRDQMGQRGALAHLDRQAQAAQGQPGQAPRPGQMGGRPQIKGLPGGRGSPGGSGQGSAPVVPPTGGGL